MISVDRIIDQARELAEERDLAFQRRRAGKLAEEERRQARLNQRHQAFLKKSPKLIEQALSEHQARFEPLEDLLTPFIDPFKKLRDSFFPGRPIILDSVYEHMYGGKQNLYHHSLVVFYSGMENLETISLFAVGLENTVGKRFAPLSGLQPHYGFLAHPNKRVYPAAQMFQEFDEKVRHAEIPEVEEQDGILRINHQQPLVLYRQREELSTYPFNAFPYDFPDIPLIPPDTDEITNTIEENLANIFSFHIHRLT